MNLDIYNPNQPFRHWPTNTVQLKLHILGVIMRFRDVDDFSKFFIVSTDTFNYSPPSSIIILSASIKLLESTEKRTAYILSKSRYGKSV